MRLLLLVLIALGLSCSCPRCVYKVDKTKTQYITDTYGRIVIYHGVNVSNYSKTSEFNLPWQTREGYTQLNKWGFNLVRYLVFWSAIEPKEFNYDGAYIAKTVEQIQTLRSLGIDVLVDIHQDLYTKRYTGNGFPDWTVGDTTIPFKPTEPWNTNYLQPAVVAAYTNFWKSSKLKTKHIRILEKVLQAVDTLDNVVGIDVLNEPFIALVPNFESKLLTKHYKNIYAMMQAGGYKTFMGYEPWMSTSSGLPSCLRFKPRDGKAVYLPHYYDPAVHEGRPYEDMNKAGMAISVKIKMAEAQRAGVPMLYSEWGVADTTAEALAYVSDFVDYCDRYAIGWAYWSYDSLQYNNFSFLGTPKLKILSRVYPQRIAGRNPVWAYTDSSFVLSYDAIACDKPTEIFMPSGLVLKGVMLTGGGSSTMGVNKLLYQNGTELGRHTIELHW